ncbi:hypothetical protein H0H93_004950 [Arthromyces matolae]|nr:hypothetical protein H0H93_004950 [Arthromyces matolae]
MPRRKPTSTRQKKADTQLKRAIKRGDVAPPEPQKKTRRPKVRRGPTGSIIGSASDPTHAAAAQAARRLQSSFLKLSPKFLEETNSLASKLPLCRPIQNTKTVYSPGPMLSENKLTCPRRPKWHFDMSKKEVEHNEEGVFKKWIDQTDGLVFDWQNESNSQLQGPVAQNDNECILSDENTEKEPDEMPRSTTYFERNLEVWRQLWRVTEISQILLILLDSRCPLVHFPPSLASYLSDRRVILVLTKVDITGPERASAWIQYLSKEYPQLPIVQVESYAEKEGAVDQGKTRYEPHIPLSFRERLVAAIREVHSQMLVPPEKVKNNPKWLSTWKPTVKVDVNWDSVLTASDSRLGSVTYSSFKPSEGEDVGDDQESKEPEFLTIGLIGQPNVGKSSLLNALFGVNRVRASKTPGKTKHFQTLFWTPEVRLVDCPGLVMPNLVPMEMQVLCGILPISRVSAVSLCIHFTAEILPIEEVFNLEHPSLSAPPVVDKRTWRNGARPDSVGSKPTFWTATDILTAYANKKKWVTAKAGRPDVHRAGNAILRALAEGRVGWGFWPPGTDTNTKEKSGTGIWIPRSTGIEDDESSSSSQLEQWEHLSQVLDLQNELARMHLEMENVVGNGDGKNKPTGKRKPDPRRPGRQMTTDTIDDGHEADEEGVDAAVNEEMEVKKAREEEFANMETQFEGRKETVQAIMDKLDQLSRALTEFHTLQAPTIEFSKNNSRQNSTTPEAPPPRFQPKRAPVVSATLPSASNNSYGRGDLPSVRFDSQPIPELEEGSDVLPPSLGRAPRPLYVEPGEGTPVIHNSPESIKSPVPL